MVRVLSNWPAKFRLAQVEVPLEPTTRLILQYALATQLVDPLPFSRE